MGKHFKDMNWRWWVFLMIIPALLSSAAGGMWAPLFSEISDLADGAVASD